MLSPSYSTKVGPSASEQLRLQANAVRELPASMSALRQLGVLDCGNNRLRELPSWLRRLTALNQLNQLCTAIFIFEAAAKIAAYGLVLYLGEAWNVFDFVVVVLSIVDWLATAAAMVSGDEAANPTFLRALRLVRVVRVLRTQRRVIEIQNITCLRRRFGPGRHRRVEQLSLNLKLPLAQDSRVGLGLSKNPPQPCRLLRGHAATGIEFDGIVRHLAPPRRDAARRPDRSS